jgi:hypothetical protein
MGKDDPANMKQKNILCQECGKQLQFLGIYGPARQGHLAQQHGMSVTEYLARHPGAPISSPGRLKRRRKAHKKWRRNGGREKVNMRRRHIYLNNPEYRQRIQNKNAAAYQTHRKARLKKVETYRNKNRKAINRRARQRHRADPERRLRAARERRQRVRAIVQAALKAKRPGRHPDDETAARVERLYNLGMQWDAIKSQVERETRVYRTVDAYQNLLKRYRERRNRRINFVGFSRPTN